MTVNTDFLSAWRERIETEKTSAQRHLLKGRIADFSEYRYSLGYIKGLDDALKLADEIYAAVMKQE